MEEEEEEAEKVESVNLNFYGVTGVYVEQWRACSPSVVIWFVMCLGCGLSELLAIQQEIKQHGLSACS